MPNTNDPTIKDMEDLFNFIKTWHMLVNERLNNAIESDYPITLISPSEEEIIKITDPEALKHVRIGLIIASSLIKPFPFYSFLEEETNGTN